MRAIWPRVAAASAIDGSEQVAERLAGRRRRGRRRRESIVSSPVTSAAKRHVVRQPSRGRQDVQDVAGEDLQEQRQEEARRDRREDGDQAHDIVGPFVLPARGDDAERHAEQRRRW